MTLLQYVIVSCVCVVQVNGHLDYMRQMDTILVAVGVPTKGHQGASIALPQPVTPAEGTAEPRDRPPSDDLERKEEGDGVAGNGWDIPDISDLLDSLDESDSAGQAASGTSAQGNTASDLDTARSEGSEDDDAGSGHVSWSWEDTNWTTEHKKKKTTQQEKHPKV